MDRVENVRFWPRILITKTPKTTVRFGGDSAPAAPPEGQLWPKY